MRFFLIFPIAQICQTCSCNRTLLWLSLFHSLAKCISSYLVLGLNHFLIQFPINGTFILSYHVFVSWRIAILKELENLSMFNSRWRWSFLFGFKRNGPGNKFCPSWLQICSNLLYFYTNLVWVNPTIIFHSKLQIINSCSQHFSFLCNYFISSMTELTTLKAQLIQTTVLQQLQYSCRRLHYYNLDIARGTSQSVTMWLRVISLSERQPLSAMVSSNSSWSIWSTFLTPASPSAANENTTGLPIWSSCRGTKQNEKIFL